MKKLHIFFVLQFFFAPLIFNIGGIKCFATCPDGLKLTVSSATSVTDATAGESNGSICTPIIGGYRPYTYLWSNGQTDSCATGLSAGTYTLLVTDPNECELADPVVFKIVTVPGFVKKEGNNPPLPTPNFIIFAIVLFGMIFIRLDRKYYMKPSKSLNTSRWVIALLLAAMVVYFVAAWFMGGQG